MKKIKSFCVDHTKLNEGIYLSRVDGDCNTYDLRFCKPNTGIVLDNVTMHTIEHMLATFARNSEFDSSVVYFGPMGCQTGFYLLMRDDVSHEEVLGLIKDILLKTIGYEGEVFGASEIECGNYKNLDIEKAKAECSRYLDILNGYTPDFKYEE